MKLRLPNIDKLMEKKYFYLDNPVSQEWDLRSIRRHMEKNKQNLNNDIPIFYQEKEKLYYIFTSNLFMGNLSIAILPWKETISIKPTLPINEIIRLIIENNVILVEQEPKKHIGYLSAANTLAKFFEAYKYLEAYFDTILQTMDASVSAIDEEGKTVVWTSGAENIFSIKQEEILNRPMTDFFPADMLQVLKTLKTGEVVYRRQHQPRPDLTVLINTNPIKLNGKIVGAVAAETDVTSQVRLNQELFNATSKVHHLQQEMARLSPSKDPFQNIKGTSPAIKQTIEIAKKIGTTKATTLILGESGVGKELFAQAIHNLREKDDAPFIAINCGAIPPSLFESELFGYEKGAFTGANQKGKIGKIEMARGGTLFLDEIAELPLEMQVKLLRVLQEKKYYTVGGTKQIDADFRVIAATNRNLEALVEQGSFREDLYYRLNVVTIKIPPLRQRKEDIIELTHYFLYEFSVRYNRLIQGIPQEVMQELLQYDWPGNIRELRNVIERLVVFSTDGVIKQEYLPFLPSNKGNLAVNLTKNDDIKLSLLQEKALHEKEVIIKALEAEKGNKSKAAKRLGITRATLYNKIKKYNIKNPLTK